MRKLAKPYLSRSLEQASILIISIWVMVFFSLLSVGIYRIIVSWLNLTKALEERLICPYLAKAACLYAQVEQSQDKTPYDSFLELLAAREKSLGNGTFSYVIKDESAKISLNSASAEILSRLPGLNQELALKITNSSLLPFQAKEEVLLIEGLSQEKYLEFKDLVTVYSDGKININTATPQVLSALGMEPDLASIIDEFRKGEDATEGTEDDGVFEDTIQIIEKLKSFKALSGTQEANLISLISQGALITNAKVRKLQIQTRVYNRPAVKFDIIIDGANIKEWREW